MTNREIEELACLLQSSAEGLRRLAKENQLPSDMPSAPPELLAQDWNDVMEFYVRPRKVLRKMGIKTIGSLIATDASQLLQQRNFGEMSLSNIRYELSRHGLALKGENPADYQ
jgi:DNA-directed RNA polymerase alpha subunit